MNSCQLGTLPSDIENPIIKGKEHCKVIELQSCKQASENSNTSLTSILDQGESSTTDPVIKDECVNATSEVIRGINNWGCVNTYLYCKDDNSGGIDGGNGQLNFKGM
ncbi:hypothetical protein V6N13_034272 [Hibiscus sabdariffa]